MTHGCRATGCVPPPDPWDFAFRDLDFSGELILMAVVANADLPLLSDALEYGATPMSDAAPEPLPVSELTVRPARFDDLERIEDLIEPFVDGGKLLPRTWDELQSLVPTGFVCEEGGAIIGFAALEI